MFNSNSAPVTSSQLTDFAQSVASEVDRRCLHPRAVELIVAAEAGAAIELVVSHTRGSASASAQIDQLLTSRRRMGAIVSGVGWSPDPGTPTSSAWLLIAVGVGGVAAVAAVRRLEEDEGWWELRPSELPWLALSSAGALRGALEQGRPLRLKSARDRGLFERPDENPSPPLDERGEL
ncbi:MAG: hypothetical protein JJT89_04840 [Nitriliruptoraceae bacterium]|nr:hypothetical protein [Nitriliruptoraceae bacterium]